MQLGVEVLRPPNLRLGPYIKDGLWRGFVFSETSGLFFNRRLQNLFLKCNIVNYVCRARVFVTHIDRGNQTFT